MKIKMELLSDAIPGSGEGTAGLVDTDITHDEYGLPVIPAKRIKGILRESARDLEDAKIFSIGRSKEIFGSRGENIGTAFKIADGYLENYSELRKFLKFCSTDKDLSPIFNRESVLRFYTYSRSQTTIDNGVAKEDTLRTFRVLKKGLKFSFDTEFLPDWKSDIETICKVTRKLGISRTRGAGEVMLTLDTSNQAEGTGGFVSHEQFKDEDDSRLILKIHNIGQLLVTIQIGKSQVSENYIPGAFILGATANAFMKHHSLTFSSAHQDAGFRNIFLNENVMFSNAYPADPSGSIYYPCPISIVKEKDKENYFDMAYEWDAEKIIKDKLETKGIVGQFVRIQKGDIVNRSVLSEVAYHHWRPEDRCIGHAKEGYGEFFQFTVVKPDQYFMGYITGKYRYLKLLNEIIHKGKIFYIGKSRTAQYGKCEIEEVSIEKQKCEIEEVSIEKQKCEIEEVSIEKQDSYSYKWRQDESVVFTLESDVILRNENGFILPDPQILTKEIAELMKMDMQSIEIEQSFLKSKEIGGFSGVWNMPKIQTPALAAGSVIVCKNKGADLADISCIENHSFGIRIEEGFGKLKVNWHGQDTIAPGIDKGMDSPAVPDHLDQSKDLIHHILFCRLEESLKKNAVSASEKRPPAANAFIGKMLLFIQTSTDFNQLNEKFAAIKSPAKRQLDNLSSELFLTETKKENKIVFQIHEEAFQIHEEAFQIHEEAFLKKLSELRDTKDIIRNTIFPASNMNEDFYKNNVFNLYQTYAIHLLTMLRLHNRKAVNRGKR